MASEHNARRHKLEKDLEFQKQRFFEATKRSSEAMQQGLKFKNWMKEYPIETSLFLVFAGFVTSVVFYPKELPASTSQRHPIS